MLVSSSYSAVAMAVSVSLGWALDGLFAAILLRAGPDMIATDYSQVNCKRRVSVKCRSSL
jgi:hypothetical protein